MQWLSEVSIRRPVFAWVLVLVVAVCGLIGYAKLSVDRLPRIDVPIVQITTRLDGAAPEEMESEVTEKLEEAIGTVAGIDQLDSRSSDGVSLIFVQFVLEKNIDIAAQEIRDRVSSVLADLPTDVEPPVVLKTDPDETPIMSVALRGDQPVREITEVADKTIRPAVESISGVGQVTIVGGQKRQINVWLDPVKLRAVDVTSEDVERAIKSQNATAPGGLMEVGPNRLSLRVQGRVRSVAELNRVVVRQADDHLVRVEDVARVEDGHEDAETAALLSGQPALVLSVRKQSGENTVAAVDAVRARLGQLQSELPAGYSLEVVRDNTQATRSSVDAVKEHLVVGALLAALVVLVFLGSLRSTVIAALAIPSSVIGTFAAMWALGLTLDTLTLLALALAVGIVIDDAIVVLEVIVVFINERKMKPIPAAIAATKEVGLAVLATTLSLIAVFLPIAFMNSIPGRLFKAFGLTMTFSIAISLIVSFSLTPMLGARWLRPPTDATGTRRPFLERVVDVAYKPLERAYARGMRWSLRHRWVVVVACFATIGSCVPVSKHVPAGFIPLSDDAQFEVNVRVPEGTGVAATQDITERVARAIRAYPEVQSTLTTIGDDAQRTANLANIYVRLKDPAERRATQLDVMDRTRKEIVASLDPSIRANVSDVAIIVGGGLSTQKVQYVVRGPDLEELARHATAIKERLKKSPTAVDVDSTWVVGNPEVRATIDRERAADRGVGLADINSTLRLLVGGLDISDFESGGHHYDIHARAERRYRVDPATLSLVSVPSSKGGPVALADLVSFSHTEGPAEIRRTNRQRQVTILSNVASGYGESDVTSALLKAIDEEKLPPGYIAEPTAQSREQARTGKQFGIALLTSIVFMYLVLAAQFGSWLDPVTILLALPLTLPFAFMSLALFKLQFDMYAMLGLLVLFGVVKKNGILQVDHANQLRRRGMERADAVVEGSRNRLRPILMTTLAFVAGMLPLLFSSGIGAGFNRSTAGIVVGGQSFSLLLTLFATPVIYTLFDDARAWVGRRLARGSPPIDRGEAQLVEVSAEAFSVAAEE
jgi:hydrophobe/amphiphile efflux-1 (HAE1) family protein